MTDVIVVIILERYAFAEIILITSDEGSRTAPKTPREATHSFDDVGATHDDVV